MEYKRTLTEDEIKALHHDLIDIKLWIDMAINGKIAKCRERMEQELKTGKPYKNRIEREQLDSIPISNITRT